MKLTIESTPKLTTMEGVAVRVWEGVTERGVKCFVFVHRIAVREGKDCAQFDQELKEHLPPGQYVSLRNVL